MSEIGCPPQNDSVHAPFGAWAMDCELSETRPWRMVIYTSPSGYLFVPEAQSQYVAKIRELEPMGPDGKPKPWVPRGEKAQIMVEKELKMMLLAGDCAVPPVGRVFVNGRLTGFIMPRENPIVDCGTRPNEAPVPHADLTLESKLRVIEKLHRLVHSLHLKNIVHGDIKPTNLLLCADGELRFCDFGYASVDGEDDVPIGFSSRYCSPFRFSGDIDRPFTKSEDLYAVGISMWEIYTGIIPFLELDQQLLENLIASGLRPDIKMVTDPGVARLITSYLDSGPTLPNSVFQSEGTCTETDIAFKDCREDPPHMYKKRVHSLYCVEEERNSCPTEVYTMPPVMDTSASLLCTKCNPVEYEGLG